MTPVIFNTPAQQYMNQALGGTSYYVQGDNAFTPKQTQGMMSPGSSYSQPGGNSTRYAAMSVHGPVKSPDHAKH
jgi:hypothetical protein